MAARAQPAASKVEQLPPENWARLFGPKPIAEPAPAKVGRLPPRLPRAARRLSARTLTVDQLRPEN
jgi:hypothetical protein